MFHNNHNVSFSLYVLRFTESHVIWSWANDCHLI